MKRNSKCTNCLPSRLNKCVNISSSITDDTTIPVESQSESASPENVAEASSGEIVPDLEQIEQQSPIDAHHEQYKLPDPSPIADPSFSWGTFDSETLIAHVSDAYDEVVHWKMNLFLVPFGSVGKGFRVELARLYQAFATKSALECICTQSLYCTYCSCTTETISRIKG